MINFLFFLHIYLKVIYIHACIYLSKMSCLYIKYTYIKYKLYEYKYIHNLQIYTLCVYIYAYIINIHITHTYYVNKNFILDEINRD